MDTLVLGGTGTVGSEVVRGLVARGATVRVLTRDPNKASGLPAGVRAVGGNLQDASSLKAAFGGVESLFLLNALSTDETHQALAALAAAEQAGVRRLVYLSVHRLEDGPHIPHFATKIPVEMAIAKSGIPFTILRPNNFYQNDLGLQGAIMNGFYPQPMGNFGLHRVDVRDIAEAAVIALTTSGHEGKTYALVGPDRWTADDTAAAYARHLGRPVVYAGDDLEQWGDQLRAYLPAWMIYDLQIMYAHFQKHGLLATAEEIEVQTRLLGHPPRTFEAFLTEIAPTWRTGAASA